MTFILLLVLLFFVVPLIQKQREKKRLATIKNYSFPSRVLVEVKKAYPHLSDEDMLLVIRGLKEYLEITHILEGEIIGMPSLVVDKAWNEFSLSTQDTNICKNVFSGFSSYGSLHFLHRSKELPKASRIVWKYVCEKENISLNNPHKLPFLFTIDSELNIKDGFRYTIDKKDSNAIFVEKFFTKTSPPKSYAIGVILSSVFFFMILYGVESLIPWYIFESIIDFIVEEYMEP